MTRNVVPYATPARARVRASERRRWLVSALSEVPEGQSDDAPSRLVVEAPPNKDYGAESGHLEDRAERFAQFARLRWQLNSTAMLLLERVTDTIFHSLREIGFPGEYLDFTIKLQPVDVKDSTNLFPWRVVIYTHNQEFFTRQIIPLSDWLGIGVDIDEPSVLTLAGRCHVGYPAMNGLVGGAVSGKESYLVTCQHVVSASCRSLRHGSTLHPSSVQSSPDAVLLHTEIPCFESPSERSIPVSPASPAWIEQSILSRRRVTQTHPLAQQKAKGVIKATVSCTAVGLRLYRFPMLEVIPDRKVYFFGLVSRPSKSCFFSYPGDSGGWVVDCESGLWVGMVTAGDDRGSSYLTDAGCLLEYFQHLTGARATLFATSW